MEINKIKWEETIPIRHKVLWPNHPKEYCMIDGDKDALHFGVLISNEVQCVASIYIDEKSARLRKFATAQEYQGQGVGSFMLNFLIDHLRRLNIDYFWFDARESAVEFYRRFGFSSEGERFFKNDIPYFKMYLQL